jgi:hypothetical protein
MKLAIVTDLDAFLALDLPGTQVVIGDGPDRALLDRRYPRARFLGYRFGACARRSYRGTAGGRYRIRHSAWRHGSGRAQRDLRRPRRTD